MASKEHNEQIANAVNILRPEFPQRDRIRHAMQQLVHSDTYFSTIPRDIFNIIYELLPELRQTHPKDQLASAFNCLAEFNAKYRIQGGFYDNDKIRRDFPELNTDNPWREILLKFIDGKPRFFIHGATQYLGINPTNNMHRVLKNVYETQPQCSHVFELSDNSYAESLNKLYTRSRDMPKESRYDLWDDINVFLLPCGLCCVFIDHKVYAIDLTTKQTIEIKLAYYKLIAISGFSMILVDDFGNITHHENNSNVIEACEYTSHFLSIILKKL